MLRGTPRDVSIDRPGHALKCESGRPENQAGGTTNLDDFPAIGERDPARNQQPEKIRTPTCRPTLTRSNSTPDRGGLENRSVATRYREAAGGRAVPATRSCQGTLLPENLSAAGNALRRIFPANRIPVSPDVLKSGPPWIRPNRCLQNPTVPGKGLALALGRLSDRRGRRRPARHFPVTRH